MLTRILQSATQNCGLRAGHVVLVGVSGGPDSLCLLDALYRLGFQSIAAYFNHRLRPEAEAEQDEVKRFATGLKIPFVGGSGDVARLASDQGKTIEEAAREMRYAFLFESARAYCVDAVAVGHNADDQVETVLMHLLRGSGLAGLRGMDYRTLTQWDDRIPLVRPLLGLWRDEIMGYCAETGLQPLLDSSNLERAYLRNRIRLDLVPALEGLAAGARYYLTKPYEPDALLAIVEANGLQPEDIASVTARVHQGAIDVLGPVVNPQTVHQAKFSMGTVLGLIAAFRSAGLNEFEEHFNAPRIAAFREKVRMELDPEVDGAYPARWIGKVSVTTTDGRRFEARVDEPKGDPGNTLSRDELEQKALRLAKFGNAASEAEMRSAFAAIWSLADAARVGRLLPAQG